MFINNRSSALRPLAAAFLLFIISGCASQFPKSQNTKFQSTSDVDGQKLFFKNL
jgi:hypothetical protein